MRCRPAHRTPTPPPPGSSYDHPGHLDFGPESEGPILVILGRPRGAGPGYPGYPGNPDFGPEPYGCGVGAQGLILVILVVLEGLILVILVVRGF